MGEVPLYAYVKASAGLVSLGAGIISKGEIISGLDHPSRNVTGVTKSGAPCNK